MFPLGDRANRQRAGVEATRIAARNTAALAHRNRTMVNNGRFVNIRGNRALSRPENGRLTITIDAESKARSFVAGSFVVSRATASNITGLEMQELVHRMCPRELHGIHEGWYYENHPNDDEYLLIDGVLGNVESPEQPKDRDLTVRADVKFNSHNYDIQTSEPQWARLWDAHGIFLLATRFYTPRSDDVTIKLEYFDVRELTGHFTQLAPEFQHDNVLAAARRRDRQAQRRRDNPNRVRW